MNRSAGAAVPGVPPTHLSGLRHIFGLRAFHALEKRARSAGFWLLIGGMCSVPLRARMEAGGLAMSRGGRNAAGGSLRSGPVAPRL